MKPAPGEHISSNSPFLLLTEPTHGLALVAQPALAAMSRLSWENRARTVAWLATGNKQRVRFLERKPERGAGRIARNAEREAERLARGANAAPTEAR
jgi:hypothetical protein